MALFCRELFKAPAPKPYPRISLMTPKERGAAHRAWWETGIDVTLEDLTSSMRMQRAFVALLLFILLLK